MLLMELEMVFSIRKTINKRTAFENTATESIEKQENILKIVFNHKGSSFATHLSKHIVEHSFYRLFTIS